MPSLNRGPTSSPLSTLQPALSRRRFLTLYLSAHSGSKEIYRSKSLLSPKDLIFGYKQLIYLSNDETLRVKTKACQASFAQTLPFSGEKHAKFLFYDQNHILRAEISAFIPSTQTIEYRSNKCLKKIDQIALIITSARRLLHRRSLK